MITPSHIAASYVLAKSSVFFGYTPTPDETALIIIAGNIIDIDFLFGLLQGKRDDQHHVYITHTPLGIFAVWTAWFILFGYAHPQILNVFIALSLILHLILDDLGYVFYRMKLQKKSSYPQINWFYPFTKSRVPQPPTYNRITFAEYVKKARVSALSEVALIIMALYVLLFIELSP